MERRQSRRALLHSSAIGLGTSIAGCMDLSPNTYKVWVGGCSHIHTDMEFDRESFAKAIRHSEGTTEKGIFGLPDFEWDIMLHLGDISGKQDSPGDSDGRELHRQWGALEHHRREQIYNLAGNHDANGPDEPTNWWFRTWIDPLGVNPSVSGVRNSKRPYSVSGQWDRYKFLVGNVLFLMLSDRNDGGPPQGRLVEGEEGGGYPAGAVTRETFEWWRNQVEANQDKIIITCHHHMLKETTVASGMGEGTEGRYHGKYPKGAPKGASYLYFVGEEHDANEFQEYLSRNPGAIDLWLGGHTHAYPDDTYGGKTHVEQKHGVSFVNCAPMTKYHVRPKSKPGSRLFTFIPDEDYVDFRWYIHDEDDAGWLGEKRQRIPLRHLCRYE